MGSEFFRHPAKRLDREFRALGGARVRRSPGGVEYRFPDGGLQFVPTGVTPGRARMILFAVQERYGGVEVRSSSDPLRSAVQKDGAPAVDPDRLCMSKHATARFELMTGQAGLQGVEVADALRFPERVLWSPIHHSWMWVRGRVIVAAVEGDDDKTVISTILWATEDLWERNPRPEESK